MPGASKTVCIACSIFRMELESLQKKGFFNMPVRFLDSNLHMKPDRLEECMVPVLDKELAQGHQVLLIYGDCHPRMIDLEKRPGVTRVQGKNCAEILLGKERYQRFIGEGSFFLFPEWILRWREILTQILDLNKDCTIEIMQSHHSKLTYLNTGVQPVPKKELKKCSEYFSLPYEVLEVSLEHFKNTLDKTMKFRRVL